MIIIMIIIIIIIIIFYFIKPFVGGGGWELSPKNKRKRRHTFASSVAAAIMQVGSRRRRCFVRESLFCSVVAIEEETWRRLACFAFFALPLLSTLALFFFPDFLCTPLLVPIFFFQSLQTFLWPCDVLKKRLWIARSQANLEVRESFFDVNIVSRKIGRGALCWRSKKKTTKRSSTFTKYVNFFPAQVLFSWFPPVPYNVLLTSKTFDFNSNCSSYNRSSRASSALLEEGTSSMLTI